LFPECSIPAEEEAAATTTTTSNIATPVKKAPAVAKAPHQSTGETETSGLQPKMSPVAAKPEKE
jgi:hypothetical protein